MEDQATEQAQEQENEQEQQQQAPQEPEEITYHAVEKDGHVTAIWEMRGRKHVRTIDPRSHEGKSLLGTHDMDGDSASAITETEA